MEKKLEKILWKQVSPTFEWNRVRSLRLLRRLRQTDVSVGSNVSLATIVKIESGGPDNTISSETKEKLANFFGVTVESIFPAQMMGMISVEEWKAKHMSEQEAKAAKNNRPRTA